MEKSEENMVNAGIIFMFSVWLQGQMSDLIILKKNPHLVNDFVSNQKEVPRAFHMERVNYWEKHFGPIKNEFIHEFENQLTDSEKEDLEEIYHVRNMIAHAHVSIGRNYMLFRPSGGETRERKVIEAMKIKTFESQENPIMVKLEFWKKDVFSRFSNLMERTDQVCLNKISKYLNVPHSRIR